MGGKALKHHGVERVDRLTYQRIRDRVLARLPEVADRAAVPLFIDDKSDFGDVDILVTLRPEVGGDPSPWIRQTFDPRAIVHARNDCVWSFNVENLQVDIITTAAATWAMHYAFLCWGDLGMIIGRLARRWGLRYGHLGLFLPMRDPATGHVTEDILVSRDPEKVLSFLGYDPARWSQGFADNDSLLRFFLTSPRIDRELLHCFSENTKHRKRERNRSTYTTWLAALEAHPEVLPEVAQAPLPLDQAQLIELLDRVFPEGGVRIAARRAMERKRDTAAARAKFSALHLREMFPTLPEADFRELNKRWTAQWPDAEARVRFILDHDEAELRDLARRLASAG